MAQRRYPQLLFGGGLPAISHRWLRGPEGKGAGREGRAWGQDPLAFSPSSIWTHSGGAIVFAQFMKPELRQMQTSTCVLTPSLLFVGSGDVEFTETRNSCKTESSLLIKKPMHSFNQQEEGLQDAAPAPGMGTALRRAEDRALPWHRLCPGTAGWCHPGCK